MNKFFFKLYSQHIQKLFKIFIHVQKENLIFFFINNRLFHRLLLEAPAITDNALEILRRFYTDEVGLCYEYKKLAVALHIKDVLLSTLLLLYKSTKNAFNTYI